MYPTLRVSSQTLLFKPGKYPYTSKKPCIKYSLKHNPVYHSKHPRKIRQLLYCLKAYIQIRSFPCLKWPVHLYIRRHDSECS